MKAPIKQCPHCGSYGGYYTKQQAYGPVKYYMKFDGNEGDNTEMHMALQYKGGKVAYCAECDKKLFKIDF